MVCSHLHCVVLLRHSGILIGLIVVVHTCHGQHVGNIDQLYHNRSDYQLAPGASSFDLPVFRCLGHSLSIFTQISTFMDLLACLFAIAGAVWRDGRKIFFYFCLLSKPFCVSTSGTNSIGVVGHRVVGSKGWQVEREQSCDTAWNHPHSAKQLGSRRHIYLIDHFGNT